MSSPTKNLANEVGVSEDQLNQFDEWFKTYCESFNELSAPQERNFLLKKVHTFEVRKNCKLIAESLGLSGEHVYLAETIGLFHDVGRFEQIKQFNTFSDSHSFDHGDFGVKVLKELDLLLPLSQKTQEIILSSVKLHNKFILPQDLKRAVELFVKIVRDADKVDIFRVLLKHYKKSRKEQDSNVTLNLKDEPRVSEIVIDKALRGEMVKKADLKFVNDFKIMQAAWVYDFTFEKSWELVKHNRYIEQLLETIPETEKVRALKKKLYNHQMPASGASDFKGVI